MKDHVTTTGIILKAGNLGEYDKRLVVLTSDYGKITVFGRGVRRQSSKYLAACSPFTFGELKAFPGKDAYSLVDFNVKNYFEALRSDFDISCLGMYFLEVADYYTRENNDDLQVLKLLYVSLRALEKLAKGELSLEMELIRYVFEIKVIQINGEYPGIPEGMGLSDACKYTLGFIADAPVEKLYVFSVAKEVLSELGYVAEYYRKRFLNAKFKSLEMLDHSSL